MSRPYERLWTLLEATLPSPEAFQQKVDMLSGPELVALYADTIDASGELRGHAADQDALADWILGQGFEVWSAAREADEATLAARGGLPSRWKDKTPPMAASFSAAYARRFDGDEFFDLVDDELEQRNG